MVGLECSDRSPRSSRRRAGFSVRGTHKGLGVLKLQGFGAFVQMAAGRKTGGRVAGVPNKRTVARRLAEAEAMCALPEHFQGNSLALLQAVYRNTAFDVRTRIDAANTPLRGSARRASKGSVRRHAAARAPEGIRP